MLGLWVSSSGFRVQGVESSVGCGVVGVSDWVVEQASGGATVASIFAENGEEAFRDIEVGPARLHQHRLFLSLPVCSCTQTHMLMSLSLFSQSQVIAQLSSMIRLVVATGGGSVVRKANWWVGDGEELKKLCSDFSWVQRRFHVPRHTLAKTGRSTDQVDK